MILLLSTLIPHSVAHGKPGRVSNIKFIATHFTIAMSWDAPTHLCPEGNDFKYIIRYTYKSADMKKTWKQRVTTNRHLELTGLKPGVTVKFTVCARCCGIKGPITSLTQSTIKVGILL